jgi:hypothetical protein
MNGKLQGNETTLVVEEFGSKMENNAFAETPKPSVESETAVKPLSLGTAKQESSPVFPLKFSKTFSLLMAEFLLVVLLIDGIYIWRTRTMRLSGHTLAHIIFLMSLIGAMGATGIGVIL